MSRRVGRLTETMAAVFLLMRGLRIIGRNYYCAYGEIDLIALHRERRQAMALVFVEVRYRTTESLGSVAASIDVATTSANKERESFSAQAPAIQSTACAL